MEQEQIMISGFSCERCHYQTKHKQNLVHHLQIKTPCACTYSMREREEIIKDLTQREKRSNDRNCKQCGKVVHKNSLSRHMKTCKLNNTQDAQTQKEELEMLKKEVETLKQLFYSKNVQNITINTTNNNIINTQNTTNNITQTINNFGSETTTHLSLEFLEHCIRNPKKGMSKLIENIHYNPEVPENHNLRCRSLKQNTFERLVDAEWRICDASNTLDELIRKGYRILNAYYAENVQSDPSFYDDEDRVQMYERFRFLSDTSCNDYFAVKRDLRLLVKDRTMYVLASPEINIDNDTNE